MCVCLSRSRAVVFLICAMTVLAGIPTAAFAQGDELELELDDIETYLEDDEEKRESPARNRSAPQSRKERADRIKSLSDLANLAPFSDVAVIQKRFLYKTERFEGFFGGAGLMNEAFFNNLGGVLKLGYYLSEKWGVEGSLFFLSSSERQVTKSLAERGIITESLVTPKGYYGVDLKWVPIYGKMAFFNNRIVPFDLYFTAGAGLTQTNQDGANASAATVKIGTGQIFAIRKWMVFRWDFSWHFFQPQSPAEEGEASNSSGTVNNLFLLAGLSFFFPESKYR